MSKIEARGDSADWNRAWEAVSRLAAARRTTLPKLDEAQPATDAPMAAPAPVAAQVAARLSLLPMARDQLARDIAEIEQAAAALRRAEPGHDPRFPDAQARNELRNVRSVWVLIALIWLSAASVVSCAIGTIILLLG